MFAIPLINVGGMIPVFDGRTPVFVELGADPRSGATPFNAPLGSIAKVGTDYYRRDALTNVGWQKITTAVQPPGFYESAGDPRVTIPSPGGTNTGYILRDTATGNYYVRTDGGDLLGWEIFQFGAYSLSGDAFARARSFAQRFLSPAPQFFGSGNSGGGRWAWQHDMNRAPTDDFNVALVGTGTLASVSAVDTSRGGVYLADTGATANSTITWKEKSSTMILGGRPSERWAVYARIKVVNAIDAQAEHKFGLVDSGGAAFVRFGVAGGSSTTQWWLSAPSATQTGGTFDNNWHDMVMVNDVDGVGGAANQVRLYVDYTLVASVTNANIAVNPYRIENFHRNGTTAASRQCWIDKMAVFGTDVTL